MKLVKRMACLVICLFVLTKDFFGIQTSAYAEELDKESRKLIDMLVYYENNKMWDKYPEIWVDEERKIFENLFNDELFLNEEQGILCIDSAQLVSVEKVCNSDVDRYICEYIDMYDNINAYLVGINYNVNKVNKSFYNGVNYRIVITGMEDNKMKIICISEAPEKLLCDSEEESKQLAMQVIDERTRGHIVDGNLSIVEDYAYEYEGLEPMVGDDNLVSTFSYRPGYSNNTKFDLYLPKQITLYRVNDGVTENISMPIYVKRVLCCEMPISTSGLEALKAQVICIQQYAAWNILYYSKYPNQGYDLKDTPVDQDYCDNANCTTHSNRVYDGLNEIYRTKADSAYAAVGNICMIIKSSGALFESRYCEDKSYNKDSDPKMYQKGAIELAAAGRNCFEILRGYFNFMHYPSYNNTIQYIEFKACYK